MCSRSFARTRLIYLDSPALVKLVVAERESDALRDVLARDPPTSSLVPLAQRVVSQLTVIEVSEAIRARAAALEPAELRSPDAIQLATALELGDDLDAVITYDGRMSEAAASLALEVIAPSRPASSSG